jgi:WD40 repeat protein
MVGAAGGTIIRTDDDGQLLATLRQSSGPAVVSLAWSPDGARLATASRDAAYIWSVDDGQILQILQADRFDSLVSLAWSVDGALLASGPRSVKISSPDDGQLVGKPVEPRGLIYSALAWRPGGGCYLASGSKNGTVQVWGRSP